MTQSEYQHPKTADGRALHALFREVFALQALLARAMDQVHERSGLRTPHKRVASVLADSGPATVPDIAARLGLSRQFVQGVCNELAAQGMLCFAPNPRHKRSRLAGLSPSGYAALTKSEDLEAAIIAELLPGLDSRSVQAAHALLEQLRHTLGQIVP